MAELLAQFPPVEFAFAYGSGAVTQGGYDYDKVKKADLPMLDVIMIVDDSLRWHRENLERNPHHYTPLLPFMSAAQVTYVQEQIPAQFWFNTYVPTGIENQGGKQGGRLMKYGIISKTHALEDLYTWKNLYLAGRLHKPVQIIRKNPEIEAAMSTNRTQALVTSLLMLPEQFVDVDLFKTIASLSYIGDPRMAIGENPKKVRCSRNLSEKLN